MLVGSCPAFPTKHFTLSPRAAPLKTGERVVDTLTHSPSGYRARVGLLSPTRVRSRSACWENKSISSGLKTPPSVLRIARALQKAKDRTTPAIQADQPAVKTHFWRGRRALAKSMSDPAKDEPDVKKAR